MRAEKAAAGDRRLEALARQVEEADDRLRRLYELVEDGLAETDDILKRRIAGLREARDKALAALDRARSATRPVENISPLIIERFAHTMREKLTEGNIPFRKAYLAALVDRIEVDNCKVRIVGRRDVLQQAILANGEGWPSVHRLVPKWRSRQDSNLRPSA